MYPVITSVCPEQLPLCATKTVLVSISGVRILCFFCSNESGRTSGSAKNRHGPYWRSRARVGNASNDFHFPVDPRQNVVKLESTKARDNW